MTELRMQLASFFYRNFDGDSPLSSLSGHARECAEMAALFALDDSEDLFDGSEEVEDAGKRTASHKAAASSQSAEPGSSSSHSSESSHTARGPSSAEVSEAAWGASDVEMGSSGASSQVAELVPDPLAAHSALFGNAASAHTRMPATHASHSNTAQPPAHHAPLQPSQPGQRQPHAAQADAETDAEQKRQQWRRQRRRHWVCIDEYGKGTEDAHATALCCAALERLDQVSSPVTPFVARGFVASDCSS